MMKALFVLAILVGSAIGCDPQYYNVYVSGDFNCSNSDVEGRLAAGGNINLVNYAINCMTYAPNPHNSQCIQIGSVACKDHRGDEPALVSGGAISLVNGEIYAGSVIYGTSLTFTGSKMVQDCTTSKNAAYGAYVKTKMVDFAKKSTAYAGYAATGTSDAIMGGDGKYSVTLTSLNRFAIFNLAGSVLSNTNSLTLSVPSNAKLVLINVDGQSVSLSNFQLFGFDNLAVKTLWNFYQATTVTITNFRVFGTIQAPTADIIATNGAINGQIWAKSYRAASLAQTCAQVNNFLFTGTFPAPPPSPPSSVCGDGIVGTGEDCDGGICCSATCKFLTSSTTCRPSAGDCDVPETCNGLSASCPADSFAPVTTPCGSNFGVCDVQLVEHCPGNGPTCKTSPPAYLWYWDAFNVISFDSYTCHGGDVEGRLAVKNELDVSGFTIGLKTVASDAFSYYELVVAGNATYVDGSINRGGVSGQVAIGELFIAPDYLTQLRDTTAYVGAERFDDAQAYFKVVSDKIAGINANAKAELIYNDGLLLTCDAPDQSLYVVHVDTATFNKVNWYNTVGCKLTAAWLITLDGSVDVNIQGAPFPGIVERVVYNIQGTRTINANNGVAANLLAPNANYYQTTGVTYGKVIVGNVQEARQNNKPNCLNFQTVTFTQKNLKAVQAGDDFVYVYDLTAYIPGDLLCINGDCQKIVSGIVSRADDGSLENRAVVASAFTKNAAALSTVTTTITDPSDAARAQTLPIDDQTSSASALVVSMVFVVVAALF